MNTAMFLKSHELHVLSAAIIGETVLLVYVSLIPFISLIPLGTEAGVPIRQGDIEHVVGYLVYGLLWARLFAKRGTPYVVLYTLLAGTTVGLATELLQMAAPLRTFDGQDILLDVFGVSVGMAASRLSITGSPRRKMDVPP